MTVLITATPELLVFLLILGQEADLLDGVFVCTHFVNFDAPADIARIIAVQDALFYETEKIGLAMTHAVASIRLPPLRQGFK